MSIPQTSSIPWSIKLWSASSWTRDKGFVRSAVHVVRVVAVEDVYVRSQSLISSCTTRKACTMKAEGLGRRLLEDGYVSENRQVIRPIQLWRQWCPDAHALSLLRGFVRLFFYMSSCASSDSSSHLEAGSQWLQWLSIEDHFMHPLCIFIIAGIVTVVVMCLRIVQSLVSPTCGHILHSIHHVL